MPTTRRDFIKSFGISIASLVLTRCAPHEGTSSVDAEQPSSNLPRETPSAELIAVSKPTTIPTHEATAITTETQTVKNQPGSIREHPMTPADGLEYYPFDDPALPAHSRLRRCWENLYLLERHLYDPNWTGGNPRPMLIDCHTATLKELVITGELSQEGARELQRAYIVAINHVLTNSMPMVCYD
ncbi:MAG: hypothetical protein A2Z14_10270 [Chloroflexi bacterium RBG_16_48_8]|nr:MAG: hypothetical protein A2Z14_10270 [Chloroflexi bacterium RBG_16_48_8]